MMFSNSLFLFPFRVLITRPIRIDEVFNFDHDAIGNATIASDKRQDFLNALHQAQGRSISCLNTLLRMIDAYIPYILALSQQATKLVQSGKKLSLKTELNFIWSSVMYAEHEKNRLFAFHVFPDEEAYTVFCRGMTHFHLAEAIFLDLQATSQPIVSEMSDDRVTSIIASRSEGLKDAITQLKLAAGVFDFLADDLLPRYNKRDAKRPPDTWVCNCQALSKFCLAQAQELFVESAICRKSSNSLIAKLLIGVQEKYRSVALDLNGLQAKYHQVNSDFSHFISIRAFICGSFARQYLAFDAQENGKMGIAVGLFNSAIKQLESISFPQDVVLSHIHDTLQQYVVMALGGLTKLYAGAKKDNNDVYFELIPSIEEVEGEMIPPPKFVLKSTQYKLVEPSDLKFFVE